MTESWCLPFINKKQLLHDADDSLFAAARLNIESHGLHAFLECVYYLSPVLFEVQDIVRIPQHKF